MWLLAKKLKGPPNLEKMVDVQCQHGWLRVVISAAKHCMQSHQMPLKNNEIAPQYEHVQMGSSKVVGGFNPIEKYEPK